MNKSERRQSVNRRSDEDEESDEDNYNKENLAKRSALEVHTFTLKLPTIIITVGL